MINALNEATSSIYDDNGRRIASIDNLDRTTKYEYDIAGRLTRTILPDAGADDGNDANNLTVDYGYDKVGRKIAETDPANRTTRFVYDAESRLIAVVLPNPTTGDNPVGIADALGRGEYPGSTIASSGVLVTRYAYDEQGNKTRQIDALNRTTAWNYDRMGRVTRRTLPLGQFERFGYDALGRLDWKLDFNSQLTGFVYDTANRLTSTRFADGTELTLTLDEKDRPRTLTYGGLTETRRYDRRDRLDQVTWSDGQQIDYTYDKASNRTQVKTATRTIDFSFDALNRLKTVSEVASTALGQSGGPRVTTYGYDGVGNRDHIVHANGTRVDYRYDRMNRLTTLTHRKGAAVLLALGYALNPDGTRAAIAEQVQQKDTQGQYVVDGNGQPVLDATRTTSYQYDKTKRLIEEAVTAANADHQRTTSWAYDKVGNRLSQVHTVPGGPTVTASTTTTSYSYDANDRLLQESAASNGITRLTSHGYDLNGSLIETTT
ncbi:RHS repeat protein, partial [Tahibacter aquaticus]|uniref:RHS repeat protein n=1 Tax=Tahibacter aquaticus TaxID=520092 RepID=UPI0014151A11